jgi:ATP-dependent helicase/nuclease subunit B
MQTFLEKVIDHVFAKYPVESSDRLCFVFPNRRAGLYLKMYLAEKFKKNIWAPAIFSAEDFVSEVSGLEIIDNFSLLFRFYDIYKNHEGEKANGPEEFLNWAPILLQDYNDADQYLSNATDLFNYLSEAKAIARWELDSTHIPTHIKDYLAFYNSLGKYYQDLRELLLSKKQSYQGLAFRETAENIETLSNNLPWEKIFFCGFNALTKSEKKIIKFLTDSGKAEVLWDCDDYYFSDPNFEAGRFLRNIRKEWDLKEFNWIENHFKNSDKKIQITGISGSTGQARYAGKLLSEMGSDPDKLPKTAVVLADESLLIPVIYSIPDNISELNITMGYNLSYSPFSGFVRAFTDLHVNAYRFSSGSNLRFHHKDITNLFNHHFFAYLTSSPEKMQNITEEINSSNRVFYTVEEICRFKTLSSVIDADFLRFIFSDFRNEPLKFLGLIKEVITIFKAIFDKEDPASDHIPAIYSEYLFSFSEIIHKIELLDKETEIIKEFSTLHTIFKGFIESTSLPFYGEPLKGLQIMGMLETRNLDFENLIILSVNEGVLPASKSHNSFIPFDIRTEFGLPTYKDKESIFAYHFYRLLQRAKNIHILYNTITNALNGGEISRFLLQLRQELPLYRENFSIEEKNISLTIPSVPENEIEVLKTPEIIDILKNIAAKGFSPTAFNSYISCPLRFYFQYIAKIREPEEVAETIDSATLGSAIHAVLQEVFENTKGKTITVDFLKKTLTNTEALTIKAFRKHYSDGDIDNGKNLLLLKVAIKLIRNYIGFEIGNIENKGYSLVVNDVEKSLDATFEIPDNTGTLQIKIRGIADRIDMINGFHRIVDYKTGSVDERKLTFTSWAEIADNPDKPMLVQLLVYAWMFLKSTDTAKVKPCILSLRSLSKGEKMLKTPESADFISQENIPAIEAFLKTIACSIFDTSHPFCKTDDEKNCEYCSYVDVCNR